MSVIFRLRGAVVRSAPFLFASLVAAATVTDCLSQPLGLQEAMDLAQAEQPLLVSQRAAIRAAEEAKVAAAQLPDPKLKAGVINLPVTGPDAWSLTRDFMTMRMVGVMQEFPRADKRRLRSELVEIGRHQKQSELEAARRMIRRDVALGWLEAYYAQRAVSLVDALQRETERQIDALGVGLKAGRTSQADIIAARIELDLLKDRALQFKRQEATARAELFRWLGSEAERPIAPEAPALPQPHALDEVATRLAQHPHLSGFEQQVKLAEADAELARLGGKPDWSVELSYGLRGPGFSDMVTVQFGIDLPVFQKNRQLRDVAAKLATADRARALRDDNLREMQAMLKRHHAEWQAGQERLERFRSTILPQAADRVEATLAAYRAGRGELSRVLEARRMQLDLAMQQLMVQADTAKAQAQIVFYDQQEELR
jgi:outer membrane protein TolC